MRLITPCKFFKTGKNLLIYLYADKHINCGGGSLRQPTKRHETAQVDHELSFFFPPIHCLIEYELIRWTKGETNQKRKKKNEKKNQSFDLKAVSPVIKTINEIHQVPGHADVIHQSEEGGGRGGGGNTEIICIFSIASNKKRWSMIWVGINLTLQQRPLSIGHPIHYLYSNDYPSHTRLVAL